LALDLESHGRESIYDNTDVTRTIGWFTSIYPVAIHLQDTSDLKENIVNVKETLREVPQNGIGYGAFRYIAKEDFFQHERPKICFNYLGVLNESKEDTIFEISSIKTRNEIGADYLSDYYLDINCQVRNGKLDITFSCNELEFSQTEAEKLANSYIGNLLNIINHCIKKEDTEITPSDLSTKSIDLDFMEEIFQALKEQ
jgi:fengycin family lipopeptide synthetase D/gramicidin S synthase 1/tyrocidine synthetase-1/tyrocidine synthetase-2